MRLGYKVEFYDTVSHGMTHIAAITREDLGRQSGVLTCLAARELVGQSASYVKGRCCDPERGIWTKLQQQPDNV